MPSVTDFYPTMRIPMKWYKPSSSGGSCVPLFVGSLMPYLSHSHVIDPLIRDQTAFFSRRLLLASICSRKQRVAEKHLNMPSCQVWWNILYKWRRSIVGQMLQKYEKKIMFQPRLITHECCSVAGETLALILCYKGGCIHSNILKHDFCKVAKIWIAMVVNHQTCEGFTWFTVTRIHSLSKPWYFWLGKGPSFWPQMEQHVIMMLLHLARSYCRQLECRVSISFSPVLSH